MRCAVRACPSVRAGAFELHRLDGLTQRAITEQLGVSITLVNFMIRDALTRCAQALYQGGRGC